MRILKSLLIWITFIPVAMLNGFLREHVFESVVSEEIALPLSGITLSGFIYLITWILFPLLGKLSKTQLYTICMLWSVLTILFEALLCLHNSMSVNDIIRSYNPLTGNLFIVVLVVTGLSPIIITKKTGN